jgi:hypothetical protein
VKIKHENPHMFRIPFSIVAIHSNSRYIDLNSKKMHCNIRREILEKVTTACMKIKTRLIIVNFLFILVILALFGLVFYYNQATARFEELRAHSFRINTRMYKTHSELQKLLTGSELAREYNTFTKGYGEFESEIEALVRSREPLRSLPGR